MSDWKEYKVGDYVSFQNGYAFNSKSFSNTGKHLVIRIKEIKNGGIKFSSDSARVDIENEFAFDKYKIKKGDVLFALTGDPVSRNNCLSWVGRIALYTHEKTALLNQRLCKAIFSKDIYPLFFYYYFRLKENLFDLARRATGSANQANISTNTISKMPIKFPPLETQKKIAAVLSALDDKIELNNAINKNLEEQAQAIFKKMFVEDFNPAWRNGTLSDIVEVRDGTHDSPKKFNDKFFLVTSKHLLPFGVEISSASTISEKDFNKINERSAVSKNDILLSMIGTVGIISFVIEPYINFAIKNVGLIKTSENPQYKYYLLSYLKSKFMRQYIERVLAGTTQKYISLAELRKIPVNFSDSQTLSKYNAFVEPMFLRISANIFENKKLGEIRDALLPRLMSGKIDVSDVRI